MLTAGTKLGPYDIVAPLGAGGMGEVYRARDTKLNRDVAIKVLLPAVANDPDRLARFSREAQVLASLNHPNIAHIYGLDRQEGRDGQDGTAFIVMELVDGEELAHRIARGPLSLDEALRIAKQIADALEAAHEQGIIHRDLKPANIKVRLDGTVKVLDFGLAKAMDPAGASSANAMNSPTLSLHATQAGIILGTAAYMSPEQGRGTVVDRRADIWAFGVVLFEMLTGRRAFEGETLSDTLASVLKTDPDWTALPAETSASIRRLLRRCLEKDPRKRLSAIGDARLELDDVDVRSDEERPQGRVRASARTTALVVALGFASLTLIAFAVPAIRHLQERSVPLQEIRFDVPATRSGFGSFAYALSPDGRALVFRGAELKLWVRSLDSSGPRALDGTASALAPTFSPDGRSIAFAVAMENGWEVRRVSADGGSPSRIATLNNTGRSDERERVFSFTGLSWGGDNVILASTGDGIVQISAAGRGLEPLIQAESDASLSAVRFLPDGKHFTYISTPRAAPDDRAAFLAVLGSRTGTRLFSPADDVQYVEPGYVLARDGQTVYAYPFDASRSRLSGDRFVVLKGAESFSAALSGVIAFRPPSQGGLAQPAWIGRTGQMIAAVGPELATNAELELAPDGRHAVTVRYVDGHWNLWLLEMARGVLTRLTSTKLLARWPTWSPDSRRVAYAQGKDLYVMDADGTGTPQPLLEDALTKQPSDWSPDGRFLIYRVASESRPAGDLWILPLAGDRKPFPFITTDAEETRAQFSPDGRWVAYESDESGRLEVYVRPFQRPGARALISTEGGIEARWNPNGREIFLVNPAGAVMSAAVRPSADGTSLDVDPARLMFQGRLNARGVYPPSYKIDYDVSPTGDRLLILQTTDSSEGAAITVVANWQPKAIR